MELTQTTYLEEFVKLNSASVKRMMRYLQPNLYKYDFEEWYSLFLIKLPYSLKMFKQNNKATYSTYINTCLKNVFATYIRDKHAQKRYSSEVTYLEYNEDLDTELNTNNDVCDLVLDFNKLPEFKRKVVKLRLNGYSYEEVAGITGISSGTAWKIINT